MPDQEAERARDPAIDRVSPESTIELMRLAQAGSREALELLCSRYRSALLQWAHGRLPHGARDLFDTEDLVQDAMVSFLPRIHSFELRHEHALHAYLRQILLNRIRQELRRPIRRLKSLAAPEESVDPAPSPLELAVGRETLELYEAGLQRLRPEDREAVILRVELHYGNEAIAEALRKPSIDAARMTVRRALVRLAHEMVQLGKTSTGEGTPADERDGSDDA